MKIITLITALLFTVNAYCQTDFPDGVYLFLEQLRNRTPAFNTNLHVTNNAEINYRLESEVDSLDKKFIRRKIFAYVKKDTLFINGFLQDIEMDYAMALTKGNFIAFYGRNTKDVGTTAAVVGGLIGTSIVRLKQYFYVLSLRTGNVRRLTKEYLLARLEDYPTLRDQYKKERKNNDPDDALLLKYIELLNQATAN